MLPLRSLSIYVNSAVYFSRSLIKKNTLLNSKWAVYFLDFSWRLLVWMTPPRGKDIILFNLQICCFRVKSFMMFMHLTFTALKPLSDHIQTDTESSVVRCSLQISNIKSMTFYIFLCWYRSRAQLVWADKDTQAAVWQSASCLSITFQYIYHLWIASCPSFNCCTPSECKLYSCLTPLLVNNVNVVMVQTADYHWLHQIDYKTGMARGEST